MDDERVKAALDDFENDKFADAKDKLADVVRKKRDDFLKKELKLQKDISPKEEPKGDDDQEEELEGDLEGADDDDEEKKAMRKRVSKALKKKQEEE